MNKIILTILISFSPFIFAATISGNQSQVSIEGGSMDVTTGGVTVTVNSGEITFTEDGKAPTTPRKMNAQDKKNLQDSMDAGGNDKVMNIKYPTTLSPNFLRHLKTELIKKGIPRENVSLKRVSGTSQLRLNEVEIEKIKTLYPPYYKLVQRYYKKKKSTSKIPTITMKASHVKKYHKALFIKYGN